MNDIYTAEIDSTISSLEGMIQQSHELTDYVMNQNDQKNLALARAFAEIIRLDPEASLTYSGMTRIAALLGVDEVHVADGEGTLFMGNEPIYFDMHFSASDQTMPFLQILEDPTLEYAQELRENAYGFWYQYYGVARRDDEGFVQVGINYDVVAALQDVLDTGNQVSMLTVGQNGFCAIIEDGVITAHRDRNLVGSYAAGQEWFSDLTLSGNDYTWITLEDGERYLVGFAEHDDILIMAAIPHSEIYETLNYLRVVYVGLVLFATVALVVILFLCVRLFIIRPIRHISHAMERLSQGDLNASIEAGYTGEFGDLKQTINHTIGELKTYITDISNVLTSMAQDNYDVEIVGEYQGDFSPIKEGLNKIVNRINTVMTGISSSAYHIAVSAHDISGASQTLAQGAFNQSSSMDLLTSAVRDISSRTVNTTEISRQASAVAQNAAANAVQGDSQVKEMQRAIQEIVDHTSAISSIVTTIEDIAVQTDLLALNAAVEAVRAGQHGRGFSVVAEQVRQLANSSQAAARETASMLKSTVAKVNEGLKIADSSTQSIQVIVSGIEEINKRVEQVSIDAEEQNKSIQQVNGMLEQIGDVTKRTTETSRETAITAEELHQQVDTFQEMLSFFRLKPSTQQDRRADGLVNQIQVG